MNEHDRNNLDFLLHANKAQLSKWFATITEDDMKYAFELLQMAKTETELQLLEVLDEVEDTDDADRVILEIMEKIDRK